MTAPPSSPRAPFIAGLAACAASLVACGGGSGSAPGAAGSAAASKLETVEVGARAAPQELLVDGVVESLEQATLSAQTSGRVAATLVDVDDAVRKGQVLVRLHATEQVAGLEQAQAGLKAATARDAQARAQFDRIADMYERKVVARATYDEAVAARDAAAAGLAAARAALDSAREGVGYTEVRAPFDGVVTARSVETGEAVAPGAPLLMLAGAGALRVTATVPQSAATSVRGQHKASLYAGDRTIEATRVTVFPAAEAQSGTFRVRAELPASASGLVPGMHVKVGFPTGESSRILVPRKSVVERSELRAVYVVLPDGRVVLRQVRLGRPIGDDVEVIAGLASGERVATDPAAAGLLARPTTATHDE